MGKVAGAAGLCPRAPAERERAHERGWRVPKGPLCYGHERGGRGRRGGEIVYECKLGKGRGFHTVTYN